MVLYSSSEYLNLVNNFELVVANPPYLPGEPVDEYESSLLTGVHGYETIVSFIELASRVLRENGLLYLVYSSLSNVDIVENTLNKYFRVISKFSKKFFLEEITIAEAMRK